MRFNHHTQEAQEQFIDMLHPVVNIGATNLIDLRRLAISDTTVN
jgi:hypothetical protein